MRRLVTPLTLVLSLGCTAVLDPGRYQGGEGADGGGRDATTDDDAGDPVRDGGERDGGRRDAGDGDGGDPGCTEAGFTCAPDAPAGWSGPIVFLTGPGADAAPACPGTAPATEFTTQSGLTADPATCGCDCTPPPSGQLSCGTVTIRTASSCFALGSTHDTIARGQCKSISGMPDSGAWQASSSTLSSTGTCTADPDTSVPPVAWDSSHRACGFGEPAACDTGVCVPSLEAGQRLCVYVDGDATCPPAFPESLSTAEDVADDRGCSACSCGAVEGSCTGSVVLADGCGGLPLARASIPVGGCVASDAYPLPHALHGNFSPSASCPPSAVSATGDAVPQTIRTVCCTAP